MQFLLGIALMLVSAIIRAATTPRPQDAKPASIKDFDFPQVEEGTAQPVVFGDVWIKDWVVLAVGNEKVKPIKVSGSKK